MAQEWLKSRVNVKYVYSVFFAEDGKQVFSGGVEGMLRGWRVGDGHEVGEPIQIGGHEIYAAAMSPARCVDSGF